MTKISKTIVHPCLAYHCILLEELNEGCFIMQPHAVAMRVKSLRKQLGITQRELAKRSEVTENYITQIESGRKVPSLKRLGRIAEGLGVQTSTLLADDPVVAELQQILSKTDLDRLIRGLSQLLTVDKEPTPSN
jgi:transcriptional regulator with XRE-family HTH domain